MKDYNDPVWAILPEIIETAEKIALAYPKPEPLQIKVGVPESDFQK